MYLNIENTANQQIYIYEIKQYTIIKNFADFEDAYKIKLPRQKNTDLDESVVKSQRDRGREQSDCCQGLQVGPDAELIFSGC